MYLFSRYNDQGIPERCIILDFQHTRVGSPGHDLNFFLYSSFEPEVRERCSSKFIANYCKEFANVIQAMEGDLKFTEEELKKDINDKIMFAFFIYNLNMPNIFPLNSEKMKMSLTDEELESARSIYNDYMEGRVKDSSTMVPRFSSFVKDVDAAGKFGSQEPRG